MAERDREEPSKDTGVVANGEPPAGAYQSNMMGRLVQQLGPAGARRLVQRRLAMQRGRIEAETPQAIQAAAEKGVSGAGGPLPHLDAIQQSFGRHDVSHVKAHVGGTGAEGAAAMGAEAFATGDQVAFAGSPSLHTAAHEAAHVVQQRGTVQLKGGVGEVGDDYERNADAVADRVVAGRPAEDLLDRFAGAPRSPSSGGRVQRAVQVGTQHLPRDPDKTALKGLGLDDTQIGHLLKMHSERDKVYLFKDTQHLVDYLTGKPVPPPTVNPVNAPDLQEGHQTANMFRFGSLYQPAPNQIPTHAPGGHAVPDKELPPSGPGHMWANTQDGTNPQHTLWQDKHTPPAFSTEIHTFGNPNDPSMSTSQGIHNMGMRINPTNVNVTSLSRSDATYGGLQTESGQVRGHPFALEQTQKSTDKTSKETFDNSKILETRESDGTKGGFSTFRYSQIENPAIKSGQPFNQVNVSSAPQAPTAMGIPATDTIHVSARDKSGAYEEMEFDNTVDYRTQIGKGNKFHDRLHKHVSKPGSYPYPQVHRKDRDLDAPNRHTVPGYMSPPPTPFISPGNTDVVNPVVLKGHRHENELEIYSGDLYLIAEASYDEKKDQTTCKLVKAQTSPYDYK